MRASKGTRVVSSGSLKPGQGSSAFDVFSESDESGFNGELIDIDLMSFLSRRLMTQRGVPHRRCSRESRRGESRSTASHGNRCVMIHLFYRLYRVSLRPTSAFFS